MCGRANEPTRATTLSWIAPPKTIEQGLCRFSVRVETQEKEGVMLKVASQSDSPAFDIFAYLPGEKSPIQSLEYGSPRGFVLRRKVLLLHGAPMKLSNTFAVDLAPGTYELVAQLIGTPSLVAERITVIIKQGSVIKPRK